MEKELKSGLKVVVRELTGLDEIQAYRFVGKDFDDDNMVGAAILQRSVMTALSLVSVNGEPVSQIKSLDDVLLLLAKFKRKDWNEIVSLYNEVNEEADPKSN